MNEFRRGERIGRHRTLDVAYQYRMGTGLAGQVSRTHPASIEACINDATNPLTFYGQAAIINPTAGTVRAFTTADTAVTDSFGVAVRPFPFQQSLTGTGAANAYGGIALGNVGIQSGVPVDILRTGYIMVSVVGSPTKGAPVFVWVAASSGAHVLGGFEAASSGSTTALAVTKFIFNSTADVNGIAEIVYNG